jgi:hypothetical protein
LSVRHGAWRFAEESAAMDQIWTMETAVLTGPAGRQSDRRRESQPSQTRLPRGAAYQAGPARRQRNRLVLYLANMNAPKDEALP